MKCPCCGGETDRPSLESLQWVTMTAFERKILDALVDHYPRRVHGDQLAARLYSGDPDGGPISGRKTVDVFLHRIRKKISATGWWVGRSGYGEGIGLRFVGARTAEPPSVVRDGLSQSKAWPA